MAAFETVLSQLTKSKTKIEETAVYIQQHDSQADTLLETFQTAVNKGNADHNTAIFYLLDYVLANYGQLIFCNKLPNVLGSLLKSAYPGGVQQEEKITKLLNRWKKKGFMPVQAVDDAISNINQPDPAPTEATAPAAQAVKSYLFKVQPAFPLQAQDSTQLSFQLGDWLYVTHEVDANWYQGFNDQGATGLFPQNYMNMSTKALYQPVTMTAFGKRKKSRFDSTGMEEKRPNRAAANRMLNWSYTRCCSEEAEPQSYDPALPTAPSTVMGSQDQRLHVFVLDLDETLIVFADLLSGKYATAHNKDKTQVQAVGNGLADLIYHVLDSSFFFKQLEEMKLTTIADKAGQDDGRPLSAHDFKSDGFTPDNELLTALRLRRCAEQYTAYRQLQQGPSHSVTRNYQSTRPDGISLNQGDVVLLEDSDGAWCRVRKGQQRGWVAQDCLSSIASPEVLLEQSALLPHGTSKHVASVLADLKALTADWLGLAQRLLEALSKQYHAKFVLVTTSHLLAALSKLMVFGLAKHFDVNDIYSAAAFANKDELFQKIKASNPPDAVFVAIGDGKEEEHAAMVTQMPFHPVRSQADLKRVIRLSERHALVQ
eukprot:m.66456 g.66456  ORF g.66456 m.66456 type:complete len:597 (+) comp14055_c0_seq2:40-1830(+)